LQYNATRSIESSKSLADFPLADRNANHVPIPAVVTPTGTVAVNPDPNPNDVVANAKVFTNVEIYTWIKPILWCVAGSVAACDHAVFQFHPNGRVLYYSNTKWGIAEFTGNPLYADLSAWGSYSIVGDKIIMSGGTELEFVKGRKKVRNGETCYTGLN